MGQGSLQQARPLLSVTSLSESLNHTRLSTHFREDERPCQSQWTSAEGEPVSIPPAQAGGSGSRLPPKAGPRNSPGGVEATAKTTFSSI